MDSSAFVGIYQGFALPAASDLLLLGHCSSAVDHFLTVVWDDVKNYLYIPFFFWTFLVFFLCSFPPPVFFNF